MVGSPSEELIFQLGKSKKVHFALLFFLLEVFIERRKFSFLDLRDFQVEGIRLVIQNSGIFLVAPTGCHQEYVAYDIENLGLY